jgi:hypothetical protein
MLPSSINHLTQEMYLLLVSSCAFLGKYQSFEEYAGSLFMELFYLEELVLFVFVGVRRQRLGLSIGPT